MTHQWHCLIRLGLSTCTIEHYIYTLWARNERSCVNPASLSVVLLPSSPIVTWHAGVDNLFISLFASRTLRMILFVNTHDMATENPMGTSSRVVWRQIKIKILILSDNNLHGHSTTQGGTSDMSTWYCSFILSRDRKTISQRLTWWNKTQSHEWVWKQDACRSGKLSLPIETFETPGSRLEYREGTRSRGSVSRKCRTL